MNTKAILENKDVQKFLVIVGLLVVLYWPVLNSMYATWTQDANNSHGILVPFIIFYLIYDKIRSRKEELATVLAKPKRFTFLGIIALIASLLFFVFSLLVDITFFKNLSFVFSFYSAILCVFGIEVIIFFLFPLFFLLFMVPVPATVYGAVALPMQLMATKITVAILSLTPLPVGAEGNVINVGGEMLTVAEACSGLRSLMSFVMLSLLFAYLAKISWAKRVLMVVLSIPVAICGNVLRLMFTTLIAFVYGSEIASGFLHDVSGYIMFVLAFLVFFWLARGLERGFKMHV